MVHERRKSIKLKNLFRTQHESNQLKISSPVLQHSTSIYSLVSPIKTSFSINDRYTPSPLSISPLSISSHSVSPLAVSPLAVSPPKKRVEKNQRAMTFDESYGTPTTVKNRSRRHSCSFSLYDEDQQSPKPTLENKIRDRPVQKSPSAASIGAIRPNSSKSTPLQHKVKTYNVTNRKMSNEDREKQRKTKELEDLITGRRKSTLKLTLTPKGL